MRWSGVSATAAVNTLRTGVYCKRDLQTRDTKVLSRTRSPIRRFLAPCYTNKPFVYPSCPSRRKENHKSFAGGVTSRQRFCQIAPANQYEALIFQELLKLGALES